MFHQSRNFVSEIAIMNWTFTEGESYFLGCYIVVKIGGQRFTKLIYQVIGAKGCTSNVFNMSAMTPDIDTHAVAHDVLHYIVMNGAPKEQPRFM